jgi:hypothetical protein
MNILSFYAVYIFVSLGITVWVGNTLRRNGRTFLLYSFPGHEVLVDALNHLLQVGFYLANVGYIAAVFRNYDQLNTVQAALEAGVPKLGGVMLILGLVHLFNMLIFAVLRRRSSEPSAIPGNKSHTPVAA